MIKTLLFDLDGTLLPLNVDFFLQHYFRSLTARFAELVPPKQLIAQIMRATEAMIRNNDRTKTNQQVFTEDFFRDFPRPAEEIMPLFDEFYANEFPKLREYAGNNPAARMALEAAVAKGYDLVVATNPVFPRQAIMERLRWAQVDDFSFQLITAYEEMHFCKPNPAYYYEILELLQLKPEECLMIGNDVEEDLAARTLGIKTFLVEDFLLNPKGIAYETDYRGRLVDLVGFIRQELPTLNR